MTEIKSPTDPLGNTCSTKLSQEEIQKPLSPVLGTGQSLKKILKNRKERHKRGSNRIAVKLEKILDPPKDESGSKNFTVELENRNLVIEQENRLNDLQNLKEDTFNVGAVPGPSNRLSFEYGQNMPENLLDRIQILEELELKKRDVVRSLSSSKTISVDTTTFKTCSENFNNQIDRIHIGKSPESSKEVSSQKYSEKTLNVLQNELNIVVNFQTGTGKEIKVPDADIKQSAKLFEDILCSSGSQSSRNKKFNYLSRNLSSDNSSVSKILLSKISHTGKCETVLKSSVTSGNSGLKGETNGLKDEPRGKQSSAKTNSKFLHKGVKNIFEGENFDDLLFQNRGFSVASESVRDGGINKKSVANLSPEQAQQKPIKNTFAEKNLDDIRFSQNKDFATVSKNPQEPALFKPVKNIFQEENFDDLNVLPNIGFKPASLNLNFVPCNGKNTADSAPEKPLTNTFERVNLPQKESFDRISKCDLVSKKYEDKIQEQPLCKLVKNIFETEHFDDLNILPNNCFKPASLNLKFGPSEEKNIVDCSNKKSFKNVFEGENFSDLNLSEMSGFKPASESLKYKQICSKMDVKEANDALNKTVRKMPIFDSLNIQKQNVTGTRKTDIPESKILGPPAKKPFRNIFEGENFDDLNLSMKNLEATKSGPSSLKNSNFKNSKLENKPKGFRNIFEGEIFDDINLAALEPKYQGFSTSKSTLLKNQKFVSPYKNVVDNQCDNSFHGFTDKEKEIAADMSKINCDILSIIKASCKENQSAPLVNLSNIENLSKHLLSIKHKMSLQRDPTIPVRHLGKKRKFSELDSDHNSLCQNSLTEKDISEQNSKNLNPGTPLHLQSNFLKRPKKRLGCQFSPTIQISETAIKRAKLIFEDLEHKPVETSTPVKFDRDLTKSVVCDLTPIQGARKNLGNSFLYSDINSNSFSKSFNRSLDQTLIKNKARYGLNKPSEGDVKVWLEHLYAERRLLEEKLRLVDEKQTILTNQKTMLEFCGRAKSRILPGVLYNSKNRRNRISLKDFVSNTQPGGNVIDSSFLHQINPQNAHLVHFYMENARQSHIRTEDGAILIPSVEGRVGISEIKHSFRLMEGVDQNLLPKGWIENHFKWIVWKLASYERMFANRFEGCLCIENVVQQLKYRYDIEIDQVKRSALHKIFEKDDCAQRRLVLCVSQIKRVNNTYELELTDGWYPIRTVIDPPLCDQIARGKIRLGMKLMTYGGELMNCEGCHPLEATDLKYLKINYNSTRRAIWWSKLGCQRDSGPFLIPLSSVNMDGGKIGCIRCFISRVYPIKYMEKHGNTTVWRNRKGEERRQQEFLNEKIKTLDNINNTPCIEYKKNAWGIRESNKDILKNIRNIDDPETLYHMLQKSSDPESIQENLSTSQKTLLHSYTLNKSAQDQVKFQKKSRTLQDRLVSSLLKIKIVDASYQSDIVYEFNVWHPQESHVQELKEGEVVTIFNASCSQKWGLSANRTTQFKREQKPKDERYQKFRRKVTFIDELQHSSSQTQNITEFDTLGIVVKKKVGDHQQVWIASRKKNLLAIKIYDSPKNILVLDSVNEGQIVTVCNLRFKYSNDEYSFAVADHFVVFSRYSQYKHLQEAVENLEKELGNVNLTALMQECKSKVDQIEIRSNWRDSKLGGDVDDMDCSQMTTTDLALLECVDKLT